MLACGDVTDTHPVTSVEVTPAPATVTVGGTVQLTAVTRDANGIPLTDRTVEWSSSNTDVATVDDDGLVTGVAVGAATITATSEGQSGTSDVAVTLTQEPVATVEVTPNPASVSVGRAVQLTATLKDAAGNILTGRAVSWSSSDTDVAPVDATGLVGGLALGTATITATSEGQSGSASVTVTPPQVQNPNEPAGAVPLGASPYVMDFGSFVETLPETDAQPFSEIGWDASAGMTWGTTVADATAPINPSTVGRTEFNPSNIDPPLMGSSVDQLLSSNKLVPPGSAEAVYLSYYFKYSANFRNVTGDNELKHLNLFNNPVGTTIISTRFGSGDALSSFPPYQIGFYTQPTDAYNASAGQIINGGVWYHLEALVNFSTGRLQLWIDGTLEVDAVDPGVTGMDTFAWSWVYGGTGAGTGLDRTCYMYVDSFYMSYLP
jgi:hypothetical protein